MQLISLPIFYEDFDREGYINLKNVCSIESCLDYQHLHKSIIKFVGGEFLIINMPYRALIDYLVSLAEKSREVGVLDS